MTKLTLQNTIPHVKAKITQNDGTNLFADAATGPANLFLHSLFSQVDISLNGTLITASTNTYPYRAMLETLLSYKQNAKTSQLTSALYYKETAGHMDSTTFDNNINEGLAARRRLSARSAVIDMMGRLHADIFFQDRYMLNEVNVKMKLIRSKDAFCLMGGASYKVQIMYSSLFVQKVKLMPSVFIAHAKVLERGTAKYPIRRVICKSFTIPERYRDVNHEKLFSRQLLTRIMIGLVDNRAFNGDRERNPFNFRHFGLSKICLCLDGQQQHATRPIEPNFGTGEYIRAYNTVFAETGKLRADERLFINCENYRSGNALYAFDLTADLDEQDHFSFVRQGNVRAGCVYTWTTATENISIRLDIRLL